MFPNSQQTTIGMLCLVLSACQSPFLNGISSTSSASNSEASTTVISTDAAKPNDRANQATHAIFQPLLANLQKKTQFPVRLPTYVPETEGTVPVYALLETVTSSRYQILLAFTEDCTGGNACRLGGVSGEMKSPQYSKLSGEMVALAQGLTGYFTPSICGANCSDATLAWEQEGARYTVALKAGKVEQLTQMANSAILVVPLNSSHPKGQETANVLAKFTISTQGIGDARIGITYRQLKAKLGQGAQFQVTAPFIVDFDAIAVHQSGQVQYYILYPAGETLKDADVIEALLTDNPNYRTVEGIGSGTPLRQAEKVYGKATLSYNTSNESREYVRFAKQPFSNIYFRPVAGKEEFAGIYPKPAQEYNETTIFQDSAIIRSVEVIK